MTAEWSSLYRAACKRAPDAPRMPPSHATSVVTPALRIARRLPAPGQNAHASFGAAGIPYGAGPSFGYSRDDIQAQQRTITNMTTGTSVGISNNKTKFSASELSDWYALARQSTAFVSADVPLLIGIDDMYTQGHALLTQLNAWATKLAAKAVTTPVIDFSNLPAAPPPTTGPDAYGGFNRPTPISEQVTTVLAPINPVTYLKKVPWWAWAIGGTVALGAGITVLKATPVGMALRFLR